MHTRDDILTKQSLTAEQRRKINRDMARYGIVTNKTKQEIEVQDKPLPDSQAAILAWIKYFDKTLDAACRFPSKVDWPNWYKSNRIELANALIKADKPMKDPRLAKWREHYER